MHCNALSDKPENTCSAISPPVLHQFTSFFLHHVVAVDSIVSESMRSKYAPDLLVGHKQGRELIRESSGIKSTSGWLELCGHTFIKP